MYAIRLALVFLAVPGISPHIAPAAPPLSLAEVERLASPPPESLRAMAELAARERELRATGGFAREGPSFAVEAGPRRTAESTTAGDLAVQLDLPVTIAPGPRREVVQRLSVAGSVLAAAARAEARLRLRLAYLEAWLAEGRDRLLAEEADLGEKWVAIARRRVESGADAPFELALVEADRLSLERDLDQARQARAKAWGDLRSRAALPEEPVPLAGPAAWDRSGFLTAEEARRRFQAGALLQGVDERLALELAFVELRSSLALQRWSLRGTLAREGDERVGRVGVAYRFPLTGESEAISRERARAAEALRREAEIERAGLVARLQAAVVRLAGLGPAVFLGSLGSARTALEAVALRLEEGKEPPSQAIALRRQLLLGERVALERLRDAHALAAEIEALTKGVEP